MTFLPAYSINGYEREGNKMIETNSEVIRLMARLKLMVRRQLGRNIDLTPLQSDPQRALDALKDIEDMAEDEDLISIIIQLRAILLSKASQDSRQTDINRSVEENSSSGRSYRFGARGG
ncbi:hypothetical protein [Tepidiphilus margaritifer]|uniref:hypothetical protein n=1 Tax=Tepidiphilus margaritifer TaxID=203471 RepID=UPI0004291A39|nr:hypothetical protein [Tepidiphilus margaritifer]